VPFVFPIWSRQCSVFIRVRTTRIHWSYEVHLYILVFTGTFVSTNLMIELGCVKDWSLDLSKFGQAWPEPAGLGSTHKPLWIGPGHIFSVQKNLDPRSAWNIYFNYFLLENVRATQPSLGPKSDRLVQWDSYGQVGFFQPETTDLFSVRPTKVHNIRLRSSLLHKNYYFGA
jgi:hypothetical protein